MLVKVCGMRNGENIRAVEKLSVDLMGFIFYSRSPRCVTTLPEYLPRFAERVGVFVDEEYAVIKETAHRYKLSYVQLHGHESPSVCQRLRASGMKVIKAFPVSVADDLEITDRYIGSCDLFLFDTATSGYGGSGRSFDWDILHAYVGAVPFFLSGGIGENDVEKVLAFKHSKLAGVDLNSRFERSPGIKDIEKLDRFITKLRENE